MASDHGRFIWCELTAPDTAGGKAFYGVVVGWTAHEMPGPDGTYTRFEADGHGVGGMLALSPEMAAEGAPPNWTGYVAVDEVDAAAAKVASLGGSVMRPAADIPGIGRFAIVTDPFGAAFAIMTPAPMEGSQPQAPPKSLGHPAWRELMGGPADQSLAFYGAMFGWKDDGVHDMGPMGAYQLFANQDGQVGGMMKRPDHMPVSAWNYYFQVGDIDAAAGRVTAGGGQVINGPMEVPGGDWVLQGVDPQGAHFALSGHKDG